MSRSLTRCLGVAENPLLWPEEGEMDSDAGIPGEADLDALCCDSAEDGRLQGGDDADGWLDTLG